MPWTRFAAAAIGCWIMLAPLLFWNDSGTAYRKGTVVGMLAVAFALCLPPMPGVAPLAAQTGPTIPKGWDYSPSEWSQRLPVIMLAVVGLLVSRYLTGYQLGPIDHVGAPFFADTLEGKNRTEQIITRRFPRPGRYPDACIDALTYASEILVGAIVGPRTMASAERPMPSVAPVRYLDCKASWSGGRIPNTTVRQKQHQQAVQSSDQPAFSGK